MQLTNDFVIVAGDVLTNSNDNTVSIMKIVDNIEVGLNQEVFEKLSDKKNSEYLIFPVSFWISTSFTADEKQKRDFKLKIQFSIVSPRGDEIMKQAYDVVMAKGTDRVRLNIGSQSLPVSQPGKYMIKVEALDGNDKILSKGETKLPVTIALDKDAFSLS